MFSDDGQRGAARLEHGGLLIPDHGERLILTVACRNHGTITISPVPISTTSFFIIYIFVTWAYSLVGPHES